MISTPVDAERAFEKNSTPLHDIEKEFSGNKE